jgi:hypothetical protein
MWEYLIRAASAREGQRWSLVTAILALAQSEAASGYCTVRLTVVVCVTPSEPFPAIVTW